MNKIGTVRYKENEEAYSKELEKRGITDNITTNIDIDGSINPIGVKTKNEYMNYLFNTMSDKQAHGKGSFDIRYHILRNPNWSLEEKQKLVMDFWYDDEEYSETLNEWEWAIINDIADVDDNDFYDPYYIYDYSCVDLLKLYGNTEKSNEIWAEIEFCKTMRTLRPQQEESLYDKKIYKLEKRI